MCENNYADHTVLFNYCKTYFLITVKPHHNKNLYHGLKTDKSQPSLLNKRNLTSSTTKSLHVPSLDINLFRKGIIMQISMCQYID